MTTDTLPASPTTQYAGFWIRWVAAVVDGGLLWVAGFLVQLALFGGWYWTTIALGWRDSSVSYENAFNAFWFQVVGGVLQIVISAPYYVIGHARYRTTFGKRLVSVYVVDAQTFGTITMKQSWGRFFASGLSYLPMCAGYLMVAFHPEKKGLHDLLAGTVSLRLQKLAVAPEVVA